MKPIRLNLFLLPILLFLVSVLYVRAATLLLEFDYPKPDLGTNIWFQVYHSTNVSLPLTNWTALTNVVGTGTVVRVRAEPGVNFFSMTASNFWGRSDFSTVASTPPAPRSDAVITISREP